MRLDASPSLPPPHSEIGLVHVKHLRAMTALAGWTTFDAGLGGSAHRQFRLVLDFAQDEDLSI